MFLKYQGKTLCKVSFHKSSLEEEAPKIIARAIFHIRSYTIKMLDFRYLTNQPQITRKHVKNLLH